MSDKKIDLIAQLLAKAESTTPEEAEALTEHAERLMVKYGIEQAVIEERQGKAGRPTEQIVQRHIKFTGAYRPELINLGAAVVAGLGSLKALQSRDGNRSATLYIIGYESDVARAEQLIASLHVQGMVAVQAWWKEHKEEHFWKKPYDQEATRRSFFRGFGNGAGQRLRASREQAVQEAGTGTELVLVSREARVQEHFDSIQTRPERARARKGDGSALGSGYRAGQQANTGGHAVGQGRGISA